MAELTPGQNASLTSPRLTVRVMSSVPLDTSALLLGADHRVRSDADMIFFNQPIGPGVQYSATTGQGDAIVVDTAAIPSDVETIAITSSIDGSGATAVPAGTRVMIGDEHTFVVSDAGPITALVAVELYRRAGTWKVRAVGQGYADGLAGIARDFGVDVDSEPEPVPVVTPPPPAAAPITPPVSQKPQGAVPMHSDLFSAQHAEVEGIGIQKQNGKMIRVGLNGDVMVRSGSMVAYQGQMQFKALGSGGIGRALMQRVTGEGVPLMQVSGRGDLFVANSAADVHIVDLDGRDGLTVNGANVLAFDSSLRYDVARVRGAASAGNAGLFNCVFTGQGRIAITTQGPPVVLNVDQATYADPQAAVAWSASLNTGVQTNDQLGLGTLLGRTTGERFTMSFQGQGFVIVQPSEIPPGGLLGGTGSGEQAGQGGLLGGLLG